MDFLTFFTYSPSALDEDTAREIAAAWSVIHVKKGRCLATQGEPDPIEHIILDGRAASQINDPDGRAVCVGFRVGPYLVTQNFVRTRDGT